MASGICHSTRWTATGTPTMYVINASE
jgi:hypothetical protein